MLSWNATPDISDDSFFTDLRQSQKLKFLNHKHTPDILEGKKGSGCREVSWFWQSAPAASTIRKAARQSNVAPAQTNNMKLKAKAELSPAIDTNTIGPSRIRTRQFITPVRISDRLTKKAASKSVEGTAGKLRQSGHRLRARKKRSERKYHRHLKRRKNFKRGKAPAARGTRGRTPSIDIEMIPHVITLT